MKLSDLDFGVYKEISPQIVEVVIDEGMELTEKMQGQAEKALNDTYQEKPYGLLINRVNPYTHSYGSIRKVARFNNLTALAIVVYSSSAEVIAQVHTYFQKNVKIFSDREEALSWLEMKLLSEKMSP
ncbi:MAG: STAS/SEC14 domain-containing protein [Sulfurimonadaceae bacterium]|nr:STAS/SEC14 domain-containing protein [Sulfurimonadaceae bacterium]